jgi:CHAT domain-containing protein
LNNIGGVYSDLGEKQKALEFYNQALPLIRAVGDKRGEATTLNNIGSVYDALGEKQKALEFYNQALPLRRAVGDKRGEAATMHNLMFYWKKANNPRFAVFYGKQSVNLYQELRRNIQGLDKEIQKTYLKSVEDSYRYLADIHIAQGRISEAEQVLAMLKEEETLSYLRRDDKVAKELLQTVSLTDAEREAIKRYEELGDQITKIGKEYGELEAESRIYEFGKFPKQARFDELKKQLADATLTFQKFLDELKIKFGQKDERVVKVESGLQNILKSLGEKKTAIVSTIVGEKRLNIIVTTADTQRAHTVEISEEEVNRLVVEFRQALTNPEIDPRPAGQKLYDILVKPIEKDLAGIGAETIVWSLDGTLRYVPTAALWDKEKGYLAERFASSVITVASLRTIESAPLEQEKLNALGVGVSKETEGFSALSAVPDELDCIITDANNKTVSLAPKCQTGVMSGKKYLDEKFTLQAFEFEAGKYPILHIASHFSLNPGNDRDSFLLLGGGNERRFTVEKLRGLSLVKVELIALSACNTATPGGEKANGVEIEGFGVVAQKQGAKAVLATLWSVADDSTQKWMVKFYELYGKQNLGKAESIRRSQLAMIYGNYKPADGNTKRGTAVFNLNGTKQIPFNKDDNAPLAHPFYWSPFILFGNWK